MSQTSTEHEFLSHSPGKSAWCVINNNSIEYVNGTASFIANDCKKLFPGDTGKKDKKEVTSRTGKEKRILCYAKR